MPITVQIHPDRYDVTLFPARDGDKDAFVTVKAVEDRATVTLFLNSIATCDALIRAAVDAKDKLIEATGAQVRIPACLPPVLTGSPVQPVIAVSDDAALDALLDGGWDLATREDTATGGFITDLRRPDGTLAETGEGPTPLQAYEHLRQRLARTAGSPA